MSYPKKVEEYTTTLINIISEDLDKEYNNKEFLDILKHRLNEKSTQNFISDSDVIITEDDFENIFTLSIVEYTVMHMVGDGIVDYVEDENGKETFFLTEKGKKIGESLIN